MKIFESIWNRIKSKIFYLNVILIYCLFMFFGTKGSIQERLELFTSFSMETVRFLIRCIIILFAGNIFFLTLFEILNIRPLPSDQLTQTQKKNKYFIISILLFFLSIFLHVIKRWAIDRFPVDQPDIVYFTLTNIQGHVDKTIWIEVFAYFSICFIIFAALYTSIYFYQKRTGYYVYLIGKKLKSGINFLFLLFGILSLLLTLTDLFRDLHCYDYVKVIKKYNTPPVDSEFYKNEYIKPEYNNIIFPEHKKNVIIIFLESMESSFADPQNGGCMYKNLIPGLTKLAEENINFSDKELTGGGIDLAGTGWTIAAMISKLGGLPFNLLGDTNINRNRFLPGAITLTDILHQNGYNQRFIFGSDKRFAGRDSLLETHGDVEVHDIEWYKKKGLLPKDYSVFWGFEDKKLYNFARMELEELSKDSKSFMLGFLTVDTHMSYGYQCEDCPDTESKPLRNSIICADRQISEFINWCKTQSWYDDTVIVIMGDHLFMATKETNTFDSDRLITTHAEKDDLEGMEGNPRRWIDIFINSQVTIEKTNQKNRKISSFDMFPTILSSMGCTIKGDRLGFGVNLFGTEKTLCEKYSEEYINTKLMERNRQYEEMDYTPEERK